MRCIAIMAYMARPEAIAGVQKAVRRFHQEGIEVVISKEGAQHLDVETSALCKVRDVSEFQKLADMVMTFGGDGTLLAAARLLMGTDVPIMGVNVGKLGFLAEFSMTELDEAIASVISGSYRIVDRTTRSAEQQRLSIGSSGPVRKAAYFINPSEAEATTSGAWNDVCHTNRNDIRRPHRSSPYDSRRNTYEPPACGIRAPSSLQIVASTRQISRPTDHARRAIGAEPIVAATSEVVTNGPMPTMSIILIAVAWKRESSRFSTGRSSYLEVASTAQSSFCRSRS